MVHSGAAETAAGQSRRLVLLALFVTVAVSALVAWGLWSTYDAAISARVGTPLTRPHDPSPTTALDPRVAGEVAQQGVRLVAASAAAGLLVLLTAWPIVSAMLLRRLTAAQRAAEEARRHAGDLETRIAARTRELRTTEERAQAILDNTTSVIYVKDLDGRYLLINRRFESLFNVTKTDTIGRTDYDLFPHQMADAFRANDRQVIANACPLEFDEVAPHEDGLRTYISVKFPLTDAMGRTYATCGISTDITARQRAEEAARRRQAELAHVLRLTTVNEMATTLAHDISQPLTAIANYATGCLNSIESGGSTAELLPAIVGIKEQATHARAVIARLREFVRKREPSREAVNLNTLVENAARLAEGEAQARHVLLRRALAPTLPPVQADPVQLEQVVLNLVYNGIEAMAEHRINGDQLVISTAQGATGVVEVTIRDGGKGLSPALAQEMFDPFVTTKAHGLGMGLAISRSIIEAHGGRIWATSHAEGGTTVGFTLPVVCSKEAA
jgi:PAS domain S-box-containing protein